MEIDLNIGNLWDDEFLDTVIELNRKHLGKVRVKSMFGSIAGMTPTARAFDRIPYKDWDAVGVYVERCQKNNIAIRYTLNHSCIGSMQDFHAYWKRELKETVQGLHRIGVHEWTVTSPLLIHLLRELFPSDYIEVSTIAEVATLEQTYRWHELGANGVNVSTAINRDFDMLTEMAKGPLRMSILANEACLYMCPWRRECYNLSSHNSARTEEYFHNFPFAWCNEYRMKHPSEWLKARLVLPQWMEAYYVHTGIDNFKLAFRTAPKDVALFILRVYMEQELDDNLLYLWPSIAHLGDTEEPIAQMIIPTEGLLRTGFLKYFIEGGRKCGRVDCDDCGYCDAVFNKIVNT